MLDGVLPPRCACVVQIHADCSRPARTRAPGSTAARPAAPDSALRGARDCARDPLPGSEKTTTRTWAWPQHLDFYDGFPLLMGTFGISICRARRADVKMPWRRRIAHDMAKRTE